MSERAILRWLAILTAAVSGVALLALGLTGSSIPPGLATLFGVVTLAGAIARAADR